MSEPCALVEHFFRHEFGRLVALLTQSLGVRRLELAEGVGLKDRDRLLIGGEERT